MILSIQVVGQKVQGRKGKEEVHMFAYVNPLCSSPLPPLPSIRDQLRAMPPGDVNSASMASPPSVPGDINFISQKMPQTVASGQTVTLTINIGRGERPLMEKLCEPRAARL